MLWHDGYKSLYFKCYVDQIFTLRFLTCISHRIPRHIKPLFKTTYALLSQRTVPKGASSSLPNSAHASLTGKDQISPVRKLD